jgi:hypothetical protein
MVIRVMSKNSTPALSQPAGAAAGPPAKAASAGSDGPPPAKFVVTLGRGSRGKTWWMRWAAERAQDQGRDVVIADADRTNATLEAYFNNVLRPPSPDDADVRDWFKGICERQIEKHFTVLLDLGGGDLILKQVASEIGLSDFLAAHGVQPVAVHLIGPELDDLAYLRDLEEDALFAPEATLLVLNEGLVPAGRSVEAAFKVVITNPIFLEALERGAKPFWMPRLAPAHEVNERRLTFAAAEASRVKKGQLPIGPWNRQLIANWRRAMEKNFADAADWLP